MLQLLLCLLMITHFQQIKSKDFKGKLLADTDLKQQHKQKINNLDYLNDSTFRTINTLFILSFKNGNVDPTRESFDIYYMPLAKNFSALIDKKKSFRSAGKSKQVQKKLLKCQETNIIQQETYQINCIIKNIINSLVWIYQDICEYSSKN